MNDLRVVVYHSHGRAWLQTSLLWFGFWEADFGFWCFRSRLRRATVTTFAAAKLLASWEGIELHHAQTFIARRQPTNRLTFLFSIGHGGGRILAGCSGLGNLGRLLRN